MTRFSASRIARDDSFDGHLDTLRRQAAPIVDPAEIERVVNGVITSLSGDVTLADLQLYREVEALGEYIHSARQEILGARPSDIREQHIPMATDELDAVVQATADATGVILSAMEEIEKLAPTLPEAARGPMGEVVVRVYEACSFQDITGQRISKVIRTLRHIEGKVDALLAIFGADLGGGEVPPPPPEPAVVDEHAKLLNGPALPASGANTQADIDAILASFD
jgi:chemotaxis protein CheZ